jgi:CHAT domain-containing protein/tetratricopeptide (TPR) repeat protein
MTTRLVRFFLFLLGCSVILLHVGAVIAEPSQQATVAAGQPGPKPSAAVGKLLDETSRLAEAKQPLESLKAADQALEAARQTNDTAGAALAQQARARTLQDLQRTDQALAAWLQAAQMWAGDGETPEQITALVQAGLLCVSSKKSEAEKLFARALSIGKSETQRPSAVAQALHDSGAALDAQAQDEPAWDYLSTALAIWEKQAPESLKLVETLNVLAKVTINRATHNAGPKYYYLGRDYSSRAAEMCHRLAPDSPIEVESLHMLGRSEYQLEDFAHAREHFLAALRVQKKLVPAGSMEEVSILRELGVLEDVQTNFGAARTYLEEGVALAERLAPVSPQFERSLENLANVEKDEGDLVAARDRLERALAINEKLHGNLAPTFINLGVVALYQSDFSSARDYFQKALDLFTKTEAKTAGIPIALGNLSETFYRQGDLVSALEYRRRSLVMMEERLGESLLTADELDGMGDILLAQGKFATAGTYYHRALHMQQKIAPESLHASQSLVSLAKVARAQKNRTVAMGYARHALELGQKSCPNAWCVSEILNDLGELAYEEGDLAGSESYLRRAVDVREKSLGLMHPDLARSLNNLALTVAAQGRTMEALETTLRAERIGAEHLRISVRTLSERQALAYEGIRTSGLDLALTLAAGRATTPSAHSEVFDAVIRSRALVFDELAARHRSAYGSGDPEVTQLANQLLSARMRLATLVVRGVGDTKPEAYRRLLDEARAGKEEAERMLAGKSIAFRQDQARMQLGLREVAASLPQGAALVAFVRYARHELQKRGTSRGGPEPVPSYAAFVLRAGAHEPEFVRLGAAREIESLLAAWRRDIARQAEVMDVSAKTGDNSYRRFGGALRRRIWDPLVLALGDAREVFVVPDTALHLISLASLPVGSSEYLIETGPLIHYLSTERDLMPAQSGHGEGILVVGNPAFDQAGKLVVATNKPSALARTTAGTAGTLLRDTRSACGTFRTLRFPPLPGSQQEAENIAALWKTSSAGGGVRTMRGSAVQPPSGELLQMTGADASSEAFEQYAPGKRVLHVATHGFFLEGSCESAVQRRLDASKRDASFLPATAENPLLLSGLAFAGANRRTSAKPDESDGILTAEEIAGINLDGVDWAVLSACDTGLGEIKIGEGVFGLRRAFQLAGAKTVIMSLWPVEDETTRQLMGSLYREHFLNGKDTGESVHAASLQILRQRRAKHQSTHPFYWGAFIAAGDWH